MMRSFTSLSLFAGEEGLMEAKNETGFVQNIALGFVCPGELMPTPALYFNDIGYVFSSSWNLQ
ncbi:hypothetical protein BDR04DRAFT_1096970 [Suillus decipiens]|nr:hypothetical protein BDR04DRAFT_1096970 [Suillus decipiens]